MVDTLSGFLTQKFREWEASTKRHQTVSAFARWVGVPQPTMTRWMTGDTMPTDINNVNKLVDRFGSEVYDLLGMPRPDPVITTLQEMSASDDPQVKEDWASIRRWLSDHGFIRVE